LDGTSSETSYLSPRTRRRRSATYPVGWADYAQAAASASLDPELARCLVQEVELWARRVAAIDAGDLRLYCVYALKTTNDRLLSNW
jgi:hypothetical protein